MPQTSVEAVLTFINAQTWAESKRIVETDRDVLLTDAADEVLANLLEQYKDNEDAICEIEEYRRLLLRCRQEGIDAAFANCLEPTTEVRQSDLDALLEATMDNQNCGQHYKLS